MHLPLRNAFFSESLELLVAINMSPLCSEVGVGMRNQGLEGAVHCFTGSPWLPTHSNPQAEKTWQEWQRFPQEKTCRNKNEKADLKQQYYVQWIRWIRCIPKNTLPLAQRLKSNYITMREHHLQRALQLWVARNIPLKHLQVFPITWLPTPLLPW